MDDGVHSAPPAASGDSGYAGRIKAGRVVSTAGSQLVILLDRNITVSDAVKMGSLVTVHTSEATVYGTIEGLSTPMPLQLVDGRELKLAQLGLLGEVQYGVDGAPGFFRRGVAQLPSLDSEVYLANEDDTAAVYALNNRPAISIGAVFQDKRVPARVSVDDLLGKHFAMLGTTGTGKSCALTLILKRILEQNPGAHILLLDPHSEYGHAFGDRAEQLTANTIRLPYWLCTFEELTEVIFGHDRHDSAVEIILLRELVRAAKLKFAGNPRDAGWISVDTPVPYSLNDIIQQIEREAGGLENRSSTPHYLRIKSKINSLQTDRRYGFMFDTGLNMRDDFAALLGRLFRVPANGKPLAILELGSIPSEVLNVVVALVCRIAFDFAVCAGHTTPLLLVCEEAHRYAPQDVALGFEPAKRALSRIAKEGRKYGISLGVISQRPSELASTILSQCNTVFAFRMSNERDQEIIQASIAEASSAIFSVLPFLGNSEAIAIGEGVSVPMRLRFDALPADEQPLSNSARFSESWRTAKTPDATELERVVAALRGLTPQ
jgi:DNA helicase HerA-like ATPase